MKKILLIILLVGITSCSSSTIIKTEPEGADLYINGIHIGKTPYEYSDMNPVFYETKISISKSGYKLINTNIYKDEEFNPKACLGIVTFPLWWMQYHPVHTYILEPELIKAQPRTTSSADNADY